MKPPLPHRSFSLKLVMLILSGFLLQPCLAQSLSFQSPVLESGNDLQVGAQYRFSDVINKTDALVTIEDLVNGAVILNMDVSSTGYNDAFQPLIYSPGGTSNSYVLFSIVFLEQGSNVPVSISNFAATTLDLDGNATLKEFSEIALSRSTPSLNFTVTNSLLAVTPVSSGYTGINIDGIERPGIDTSTLGSLTSMYTVKGNNVEDFTVKFGAVTNNSDGENRQHSLYMKDFKYNNFVNNFSTLPVKIISFAATLHNSNVDLKWITTAEVNVNRFVIEKSTDGINFSNAGIISAQGNAVTTVTYNFSDNINAITKGVVYYRLRSIDIDNKSELSETRIIRIGKQNGNVLAVDVYPNPVSSKINITIPANWQNKKVDYELYDANGILAKKLETTSSSQTEAIDVRNLASGVYIIKVKFEGLIIQQRIIKQ